MIVTAEQMERFYSLCRLGIGTKPRREGLDAWGKRFSMRVLNSIWSQIHLFMKLKSGGMWRISLGILGWLKFKPETFRP